MEPRPAGSAAGYPVNVFHRPSRLRRCNSVKSPRISENPMVQKWNFAIQQQLAGADGPGSRLRRQSLLASTAPARLQHVSECANSEFQPELQRLQADALHQQHFGNSYLGFRQLRGHDSEAREALLERASVHRILYLRARPCRQWHDAQRLQRVYAKRSNKLATTSYASAAWDIRHNFVAGFDYDIPFGRGKQYGANLNRVL